MPRRINNAESNFKGRHKRRRGSGKKGHQLWQLKRQKPLTNKR